MAKKSIRLQKLERVALERASEVVLYELSDPRLERVTITRADLAADLSYVTLYWSVLGTPGDRSKVDHALRAATGLVQGKIAAVFSTRTTPRVRFEFDPSIEGGIRVTNLIDRLAAERIAREGDTPAEADGAAAAEKPATSEEE
jgi:ribosome-binding factor A